MPYFLTGVTFLDRLVLEEFNWRIFSGVIQNGKTEVVPEIAGGLNWLVDLFDRRESQNASFFSQFLMDRARAGSLWVKPQMYTNLALQLLKILRNE